MRRYFGKASRCFFSEKGKVVENIRKQDNNRNQSVMNSDASRGTSGDNLSEDNKTYANKMGIDTKTEYINPEGHKIHDMGPSSTVKTGMSSKVADFTSVNQTETHNVFENKNKDKTFYKTSKDINLHNNIEKDIKKKE